MAKRKVRAKTTTTSVAKSRHDVIGLVANLFLGADLVAVLFNRIIVAEADVLLTRGMEEQAMLRAIEKIDLGNKTFCGGVLLAYAALLVVNYFLYRTDKKIPKYVMLGIYVAIAVASVLYFYS